MAEKTCSGCDRLLPRSAFDTRGEGTGWISWRCRECTRVLQMNRYLRRRRLLDAIRLAVGCVDCGYNDDPRAMDFDHVRGEKKFGVIQGWGRNMKTLLDEIEKCEVRCANCHRIKTWPSEGRAAA